MPPKIMKTLDSASFANKVASKFKKFTKKAVKKKGTK